MSSFQRRNVLKLGLGSALLGMAGCRSLLIASPPKLYVLTPPATIPPASRVDWTIAVAQPISSAGVDTSRIALRQGANRLDYFADAAWSDRLPLLMQGLLIDALQQTGAFPAVERDSAGLPSGMTLLIEIKDFSAHYDAALTGAPIIRLHLVTQLMRSETRQIIDTLDVVETASCAANAIEAIVPAFNRASDAALARIAAWTLATGQRALSHQGAAS